MSWTFQSSQTIALVAALAGIAGAGHPFGDANSAAWIFWRIVSSGPAIGRWLQEIAARNQRLRRGGTSLQAGQML